MERAVREMCEGLTVPDSPRVMAHEVHKASVTNEGKCTKQLSDFTDLCHCKLTIFLGFFGRAISSPKVLGSCDVNLLYSICL